MNKLFVVSPPKDIFDRLRPDVRSRIECLPDFLRYPKGRFKQITRSLMVGRIPLPRHILYLWFNREEFDRILHARPGDTVLIYECCNVRVLRAIRPFLPKGVTFYIYYCNPIHTICKHPKKQLQAIRELGYRLSSFDARDADEYGLTYTGQFFCYPDMMQRETVDTDCFFCGLPKDRFEELQRLQDTLEEQGLSCRFIIPHTPAEKVDYATYLRLLDRSRCVVDIAQKNQPGLTRRPLEALFYKKKLITNNPDIRQYDFYNPKNIFIFGIDSVKTLTGFIQSPFEEVDEDIRKKYDVNEWIANYLPK